MSPETNDLGQPIGPSLPGWLPPPFPSEESMDGAHCRLVRLDATQHGRALFDSFAEDAEGRNWTYLPSGPFDDFEEFAAWLKTVAAADDPQFYTILRADTGEPAGLASFLRIVPASGSIEVGHIHFANCIQRSPAATEAMFLMMKRAFELGYRRYEWKCDALNAPSRAAAERLGFSFEGVFRQATVYKGRNRDTAWYAIIDSEWPALKHMFSEWLAEENFDESGRQRRSLRELRKQWESIPIRHGQITRRA